MLFWGCSSGDDNGESHSDTHDASTDVSVDAPEPKDNGPSPSDTADGGTSTGDADNPDVDRPPDTSDLSDDGGVDTTTDTIEPTDTDETTQPEDISDVETTDTVVTVDTGAGDSVVIPPQKETECDDNKDNDEDGAFDCDDPDCQLTTDCTPTCKPVAAIACKDTKSSATNTTGSTSVLAKYSCQNELYTGPEIAWSFSVDDPTIVTVSLSKESDATDVFVVADNGNGCFAEQCIDHGLASAAFVAKPKQDYYLIVDGYKGAVGNFDITVNCETCVPKCKKKVCGGDGCGGSCGDCAEGKQCSPDQKACISPPENDLCTGAEEVEKLPFKAIGETEEALDNYDALGKNCVNAGTSGGPDLVYSFTPPTTSMYRIELNDLTFDAALYIVSDCSKTTASCVAGVETLDDEILDVGLSKGQTYFIVVDGVDELETGSFGLTVVTLGPCTPKCDGCGKPNGCGGICECKADNDTCATATVIDPEKLPTTVKGSTSQASDEYWLSAGDCPGQATSFGNGGGDVVYSFTPKETAEYSFAIPFGTGADFDASLYLVTDCADLGDACVAASEITGLGGESVTATLEKGLTYFVIVDGYKSNAGDFSLDVGLKGTVGACGAVAAVGCCKNTELFSCINEQLESTECGETKGCGWDPAGNKGAGWYACGGKGADPSGKNPLACPNL